MINKHDFNSLWWGSDVGIIKDINFFNQAEDLIGKSLEPYDWVELRALYGHDLPLRKISQSGFFQVDTQIRYRLKLSGVSPSYCAGDQIESVSADVQNFKVDEAHKPFIYERNNMLPGITQKKVSSRYIMWANSIIEKSPSTCLQISAGNKIQGWVIGQAEKGGLNIALVMLHSDATISGTYLFEKFSVEMSGKGYKVAFAGFSVNNHPVHNIHSFIGARYITPELFWFWIK